VLSYSSTEMNKVFPPLCVLNFWVTAVRCFVYGSRTQYALRHLRAYTLFTHCKQAVGQIKSDNLNEIRSLKMPPEPIADVLGKADSI
jgi:hypothetical protein